MRAAALAIAVILGIAHPLLAQDTTRSSRGGAAARLPCGEDCNDPVPPTVTIVTPGATVNARRPVILIRFSDDKLVDGSDITVKWGGSTVTEKGRSTYGVWEWEVDSAYALAPNTTKQVYARVCDPDALCTTVTRDVTLPAAPRPILSVLPMPLEAHGRRFRAPFGGFAVSGPDIQMAFATPAYSSLNTPRTAGLTYSSQQSYPRALVNLDLEFPGSAPSSLTMKLWDGAVVMSQFTQTSPSCSTGGQLKCRVAMEASWLSASSYPAVRKWLKIEALATISGNVYSAVDSVEVVLVDRRTTPYGSGWWPSGVMRIVESGDDAAIVASDGSATIYRGNTTPATQAIYYVSPLGQTASLMKYGDGSWRLSFKGGGYIEFDTQGRQSQVVDANGNMVRIRYGGTDAVDSVVDPLGKAFKFWYAGPNGTLSAITDPGGWQTSVTVDASRRLVRYALPSPPGRTYTDTLTWNTYTGSAVLPRKRMNVLGSGDSIVYTAGLRPWQVMLPKVANESGDSVRPVIQYAPKELKGLNTLLSLTSLWTEAVDPRGNWVRLQLNRWGSPLRTWDTVGTISVGTYDGVGRVLTVEGKAGDSTRVYNTYDASGRLVRVHRVKMNGMPLRLDSLVYDTNDRVVRRVDAQNLATDYTYDANGNLTRVVSPDHDTTRTWYGTYGQVDSVRTQATVRAMRYTYDPTWRNTAAVIDQRGDLVEGNEYDGLGRRTSRVGQIPVRRNGPYDDFVYQWRRTLSFYNVANQPDSVRTERSADCADGCYEPTWPSPTDLLATLTTRFVYDALGRDSVRTVQNAPPEVSRYDALGRVVQHWPHGTGYPSLTHRYDVAGNLRFTTTRRGDTLESQYDSRSRVTRSLLGATVGTFNYTYGGPNDELTAVAAEPGYADPVGGSQVNASWTYNQSGFLLTQTTQGTRTTTYTYDLGYYRVRSASDPRGAWEMRYHRRRQFVDSLLDPTVNDWITYQVDSLSRLNGPYVNTAPVPFTRTQAWSDTIGGLNGLTNSHGYPVGVLTQVQLEVGTVLGMDWQERHDSGGPTTTMADSVAYDGWHRLMKAVYWKNGLPTATDTFAFDGRGNLTVNGNGATYNDRDQLTGVAGCTSLSYDAAGNLTGKTCGGITWTLTYDALDRLTNVTNTAGLSAAYTYDVLGNRIAKKVGAAVTRFVWRGGHVVYETTAGGTITYSYIWGISTDDLVAVHDHGTGEHHYVVQDKLRSVRGLVNRDGTWVAAWRFRAYGVQLDSAGSAPAGLRRFRWAGAQYDEETGFYFLRSRYYEPTIGRFVQEDPAGRAGGLNLYAYVEGDPFEARDPGGMKKDYDQQYVHGLSLNSQCLGWCDTGSLFDLWWFGRLMGIGMAELQILVNQAAGLAASGVASVTIGSRTIEFSANTIDHPDLASVYTSVFVQVMDAAFSTPGVNSIGFSSGYRTWGGTPNLNGEGNGKVVTHRLGLAVDITLINGKHVGDAAIAQLQAAFMSALRNEAFAREVYGPRDSMWRSPNRSTAWASKPSENTGHYNHIHFSSDPIPRWGGFGRY